ncbi:CapA family protein [Paenibacillus aceris]|uniref:Poly-gamma-glutamate synthesis protein (Capsule biosynthesis protein) n=1 Tax=Paenibacillus aceris TaxID=869555 RepID=A0ABS4I656_9BACL|nr:CapA family protein [Paenibacillus aceris]MBP1966308.1 poly-gamma-glutamate synthesis protein (capsule biosynthesis protein) [Paenibacillus aceris]NHW38567.1 CapA family protein [Paenibacillus aceris]
MVQVTIAAVGDLLMKSEIIAASKQTNGHAFDPIFEEVAPILKAHDLTLGNLETTFSGERQLGAPGIRPKCNCPRERRNPRTGLPVFNCPDELAGTLKKAGFHVLTTANNHCMDGGTRGVKRTLQVLDAHNLHHTGTARSAAEAKRPLIVEIKGVRIGIVAYTERTNAIPVPKPWFVNRFNAGQMAADIREMRDRADFIIACLHFGKEYRSSPDQSQKKWMRFLFRQGVNVVLGAHPHVLHPVTQTVMKDKYGQERTRVAASSLGNFVSTKLNKGSNTVRGMILSLTLSKNENGQTDISGVEGIPTLVERRKTEKTVYTVVPERKR